MLDRSGFREFFTTCVALGGQKTSLRPARRGTTGMFLNDTRVFPSWSAPS